MPSVEDTGHLEQEIGRAAGALARVAANTSDDPEVRAAALRTAVREVSWRLFDEFGDHCRLAEELEIMSRLAWWGPEALRGARATGPSVGRRGSAT